MKLTLSGDEVVWSLVTLCDRDSKKMMEKRKKKRWERVNNYKSTWWSETQGPLTLISLLPFILFLHFQHQVISYSSQSWVSCQRSAEFLFCFWLKIFQRLWKVICACYQLSMMMLCLKYTSMLDWPNSLHCLDSGFGAKGQIWIIMHGEMALIQVFLCLSLSQVITCRVRELHFKGSMSCSALHAASAADQK